MSNTLKMNLTGRNVVLLQSAFDEELTEAERTVKVYGGFGAEEQKICLSLMGGALYVEFPNGATGTFRGMDVEKLA